MTPSLPGAILGGTNYKGKTPLHYAVQRESPDMLEMLLSMGAPIPANRINDPLDGDSVDRSPEHGLTVWGLVSAPVMRAQCWCDSDACTVTVWGLFSAESSGESSLQGGDGQRLSTVLLLPPRDALSRLGATRQRAADAHAADDVFALPFQAEKECRPKSFAALVRWGGYPPTLEADARPTDEWALQFPGGVAAPATLPSWAAGPADAAVAKGREEMRRMRDAVEGCWSLSTHAMLQPRFDGVLLAVLLTATVATASLGLPRLPTELWWEIFARCKVSELQRHPTKFQLRRRLHAAATGGGGAAVVRDAGGGGVVGGGGAGATAAAGTAAIPSAASHSGVLGAARGAENAAHATSSVATAFAAADRDDLFD